MNGKRVVLIITLVLIVIIAIYCYFKCARKISTDGKIDLSIEEVDKQQETHGAAIFEDDNIDVNMLGIWKHSIDTGWHKVYTTEPADSNCCWGREWNTSEDVFEIVNRCRRASVSNEIARLLPNSHFGFR